MAGLEPVIHATAHNILDQPEGPRANRLVVEVDVQVFGLHRPIRRYGEFDATPAAQPNGLTVVARGVIKGGAVTANFTF